MDHSQFVPLVDFNWVLLLCITLLFTISVLVLYYQLDEYDPEPPSHVFVAFLYGIIVPVFTIPLFYGIQFLLEGIYDPLSQYLLQVVFFTPLLEEVFKGYFLIKISQEYRLDGPMDGIIYGIAVGSGFATIENLIYGFSTLFSSGITNAIQLSILRGGFAFIGHPIYTAIFGYGLGATQVGIESSPWKNLGQAVIFHIMWNGVLLIASIYPIDRLYVGIILLMVIVITIFFLLEKIKIARKIEILLDQQGYYDSKDRTGYSVRLRDI